MKSEFLASFGRPARNICDAAERSSDPTVAQALHVINGDTLNKKLSAPEGTIALFLKLGLSRPAHRRAHVPLGVQPVSERRRARSSCSTSLAEAEGQQVAGRPQARRWRTWSGPCSPARSFYSADETSWRSRVFQIYSWPGGRMAATVALGGIKRSA